MDRKTRAITTGLLLIGGGVTMGALASQLTSDAMIWRAAPRIPTTEAPVVAVVDQAQAGKGWARTAFDGGLRQCPNMNPDFLAACEAEMKALAARPAFQAGSYGGPLLITKVEPAREERSWEGYDRLETPPVPALREIDYAEGDPPPSFEPAYEPTPENYPAAPEKTPR